MICFFQPSATNSAKNKTDIVQTTMSVINKLNLLQ